MLSANPLVFVSVVVTIILTSQLTIACPQPEGNEKAKAEECSLPQSVIDDIASYADVTNRIIDAFTKGAYKGETWNSLAKFVDKFGDRISGSQALENAIDYMVDISKTAGLEVHTEDVEVPDWVRGEEKATLLQPKVKNIPLLGLGYSVSTPPGGITAEVVVVQSFDELQALPAGKARGKIVLYDQKFKTYGETVQYRSRGASEASKLGAVAALVRSITPFSLQTPHTGMQTYAANVTEIPVAAITLEDADLLWRMQERGQKVVLKLVMSATIAKKISRNTIADLKGSTMDKKIVVVSGHIDSWDVGDGAMDDGAGVFISYMAPVVLKKLGLQPKRTLRAIFWTAEELGLIGAEAYVKAHAADNDNLNFVMESDFGTFTPLGLTYSGSKQGECMMREILKLFAPINATQLVLTEPGPDISFWTNQGIPGGGLHNDNGKYFWYHHTDADTINVIDPDVLDLDAAFWTAFSYIVADMASDIPRNGSRWSGVHDVEEL